MATTGSIRTPPKVRVQIDHCIRYEALVLQEEATFDTLTHIFFLILTIAATLHAGYVHNFTVVDRALQEVYMAELTERVLAH